MSKVTTGPNDVANSQTGPSAQPVDGATPKSTTWTPGTTGNIQDPTYARSLIDYYGSQPGADPSLKNDPNYWMGKLTSGTFGSDQNYAIHKMQNGWKETPGASFAGMSGGAGPATWSSVPLPSQMGAPAMPTAAPQDPAMAGFYQQLMNRSGQSLAVDPNDPVVRNQVDSYAAQQTRQMRNNLAGVAEASGPNANISAETRSAAEKVAQNTSGFQAQVIQREIDARRQEIAQALTLQGSQLTLAEQSRLRAEDQALQSRSLQLGAQMNDAQIALENSRGGLAAQGQGANQAQQAWQDQYTGLFG